MDRINILVCTDDNYVPQCGIMLTSLLATNIAIKFSVFVFSGGLSAGSRERLRAVVGGGGSIIEFITVEERMISRFASTIKEGDHVSLAAYYRLFCAELLPHTIDKLLYLDCDIIVNHNILEIWNCQLGNYAIGAIVDENYFDNKVYERLGLNPSKYKYFNSGVLLINLRYWREHNVTARCIDCVCKMPEKLLFHDQDTLNVVLKDEIAYFPISWNFQTGFLYSFNQDKFSETIRKEITDALQHPYIIHYTGKYKPWFKGSRQPYTSYYLHHKSLSLWRGTPLLGELKLLPKIKGTLYNIMCLLGIKKKKETYILSFKEYAEPERR